MKTTDVAGKAGAWPSGLGTLLFGAAFAFAPGATNAQVFKCRSGSGQLVYSDVPCQTGHDGGLIEKAKSQGAIARERQRAADAEQRKQDRYLAEDERTQQLSRISPAATAHAQPNQPNYEQRLQERNAAVTSVLKPRQAKRTGNPSAVPDEDPPPPNRSVHSCLGGNCSDRDGTRYTQNPVGGGYKSQDGKSCMLVGREMRC